MGRLPLGQWLPDLAPALNARGLVQALNTLPQAGGYGPIRELAPIAGATALDERPRGSLAGLNAAGSGYLYAGSETKLWLLRDAGMVDISGGTYAMGPRERWAMANFKNTAFATSASNGLQHHTIGSTANFAAVGGFSPRARHLAVVRNFLVAGNIYSSFAGTQHEAVSWCAINNGLIWPHPGTPDAIQVQSGQQELGAQGWVQDVVEAAEVGVVFQEHAITRMDYNSAAVWRFTPVEKATGMLVPGSAVAFDRGVFYIAQDGFRVFDLTQSVPVGHERVNKYFLADLDTQYLDRVYVIKDPHRTVIWVLYPGAGNTLGLPNKLLFYDYVLDRFTHGELEMESLIQNATTAAPSLDAPENLPDDPLDIDDPAGEFSFDDRASTFGDVAMGAFDSSFLPSDFSGNLMEALIETGDMELTPGGITWIGGARPIADEREPTVSIAETFRRDEEVVFGAAVPMDADGKVPFRSQARYHRLRMHLPAGWTNAIAFDLYTRAAGRR